MERCAPLPHRVLYPRRLIRAISTAPCSVAAAHLPHRRIRLYMGLVRRYIVLPRARIQPHDLAAHLRELSYRLPAAGMVRGGGGGRFLHDAELRGFEHAARVRVARPSVQTIRLLWSPHHDSGRDAGESGAVGACVRALILGHSGDCTGNAWVVWARIGGGAVRVLDRYGRGAERGHILVLYEYRIRHAL